MRSSRDMARHLKAPHKVTLYQNGQAVGDFTIPRTDTRFVKDDDLIMLAFQAAHDRAGIHLDDLPAWDMLSVNWFLMSVRCDKNGCRIYNA